jgi:hypothetical protein
MKGVKASFQTEKKPHTTRVKNILQYKLGLFGKRKLEMKFRIYNFDI